MFDREIVVGAPAQRDGAGLKFNSPLLGRIRVEHESRHQLCTQSNLKVTSSNYNSVPTLDRDT